MPSAYNKRLDDYVRTLITIVDSNKNALGIKRVYYGDQNLIPDYPSVTIQSGGKERRQKGLHEWEISLAATIRVYHGAVQSSQVTMEEMDKLVEDLENVLHGNLRLNNTVIFGFVTQVQPGVLQMEKVMVRATQLTHESLSKEVF